jgi:CRISPR-associated protein Cmr1
MGDKRMARETVTATFEIVTPMFIAGANNGRDGVPELRVPSILGALRFWWRALAWARLPAGDLNDAIRRLKEWEAELFGSAQTGQGRFVARVTVPAALPVQGAPTDFNAAQSSVAGYTGWLNGAPPGLTPQQRRRRWQDRSAGVAYLAGQGLTSHLPDTQTHGALKRTRDTRPSIAHGSFNLMFLSREPVFDRALGGAPTIREAVLAFGLLGGLGARTRRGFGSIRLVSLTNSNFEPPVDLLRYQNALKSLLGPLADAPRWSGRPPFSAFWRGAIPTIALGGTPNKTKTSRDVLTELGESFQRFRGWGSRGKVGGQTAEWKGLPTTQRWRFEDDHDWYKAIERNPSRLPYPPVEGRDGIEQDLSEHAPKRSVFGLPSLYKKIGEGDDSPAVRPGSAAAVDIERRASPLFFHVHRVNAGNHFAVVTLFEATFLPKVGSTQGTVDLMVQVGSRTPWNVDLTPDWVVARSFLTPAYLGKLVPVLP